MNNNKRNYRVLVFAGIGFTESQITVLEGESVDISILVETSDGQPLDADQVVTLRISDNVGSGNTPIDLSRLVGSTIMMNAQNDLVASITVPMGHISGSTIPFTGISIAENVALDGELMFLLFIEGFEFAQTSGGGIVGFTTVTVDDDDDSKFTRCACAEGSREHATEGVNRVFMLVPIKYYC